MSPITGKVESGIVKLAPKGILPDGQKVVVIPLSSGEGNGRPSPEAEQEDVEFIRAGRGRLARQLRSEDEPHA